MLIAALTLSVAVLVGFSALGGSNASASKGAIEVAHDSTSTYTNPTPCSSTVQDGVCISQITADYGSTTITLTMTVGLASDPLTSPAWGVGGASFVEWYLPVDGAGLGDRSTNNWDAVAGLDSSGQFVGITQNYATPSHCLNGEGVNASFDLAANSYSVSFPASCIDTPASFSVSSEYSYGGSGDALTAVAPPPEGVCCTVGATSSTTTTTTTTTTPTTTTPTSTPPTPAPAPTPTPPTPTPTPPSSGHGYWLVGSDGGIFTFGDAQFYGSTGALALQRPVVGITPTANDGGYWLVASDGGIFSFGNAGFYGSIPGLGLAPAGSTNPERLNAPIVGMVPSADGGGYFMVASDGGVFAFGDAKFEGSCPGIGGCSGAAVAVMPDASGNAYWLVTATGNVYTFGDAAYYGEPGAQTVPVTGAVSTRDGGGYWLLFANGVVAPYGDAGSLGGPVGAVEGVDPATAIFSTSDGAGYWVASASGSVYNYGDAPDDGGMAGTQLNGSIITATGW